MTKEQLANAYSAVCGGVPKGLPGYEERDLDGYERRSLRKVRASLKADREAPPRKVTTNPKELYNPQYDGVEHFTGVSEVWRTSLEAREAGERENSSELSLMYQGFPRPDLTKY